MENKFKVLMYGGLYVSEQLLPKGLYMTSVPHLRSMDDTIEKIAEQAEKSFALIGVRSDKYFESLSKCKLVEVTLTIEN